MNIRKFLAVVATTMGAYSGSSLAVPALQLDIAGGSYVGGTEQSVITTSDTFDLYAYMQPGRGDSLATLLATTYYLSIALQPAPSSGGSYGSILVNSTPYNVTSDMIFGNPPVESALLHDGGDLGPHSIFPTYYLELSFKFGGDLVSGIYNVQDDGGQGPIAGTGMYYKKFALDISGLDKAYDLHFDLYSKKEGNNGATDVDIDQFAPFSKDAGTRRVPEPGSIALVGLALLGIGVSKRFAARQDA